MNTTGNSIKSKLPNLPAKSIYSDIIIKNCGFSPYFFDEINNMEKDSIKNVHSDNTIVSIPFNITLKEPKKISENENNKLNEKQIQYNNKNDIINNNSKIDYKTNDDSTFYDPHIHFEYLSNNINNNKQESSQVIEAYKSKHKSKFIKIYENNSINFNEKNKNKLFHKCCYPGCNRTFASSGWLKAHFKEHLKQVHNSLFCKLFRNLILNDQVKLTNHLNNNFLGLKTANNDSIRLKQIHEIFNIQNSLNLDHK